METKVAVYLLRQADLSTEEYVDRWGTEDAEKYHRCSRVRGVAPRLIDRSLLTASGLAPEDFDPHSS